MFLFLFIVTRMEILWHIFFLILATIFKMLIQYLKKKKSRLCCRKVQIWSILVYTCGPKKVKFLRPQSYSMLYALYYKIPYHCVTLPHMGRCTYSFAVFKNSHFLNRIRSLILIVYNIICIIFKLYQFCYALFTHKNEKLRKLTWVYVRKICTNKQI